MGKKEKQSRSNVDFRMRCNLSEAGLEMQAEEMQESEEMDRKYANERY